MKATSLMSKISAAGLSVIFCLALAGCASGNNYGYTGGVAATVNGVEISEDDVTKYIQDFRTSLDLTSDEAWGKWLAQSGQDASAVRSQVIDYKVEQELEKQAAQENGVTVDDAAVDEQINTMKANYSSDDAWKEALEKQGITEDQYREALKMGLLERDLQSKVVGDGNVDDAELLNQLNSYKDIFNGAKRSSHILFATGDEETAQDVLSRIRSGELDFAEAAKQYSTDKGSAENGGDVGWDCTNSFVEEYTTALQSLDKDQVSDLVTSQYGIHIIKCTDVLGLAENPVLSDYPQEIIDYMRQVVQSQNQSSAYSDWMDNYKEQAEIVINDMPENVSYNIDITQYEETQADEATADQGEVSGDSDDASTSEENPDVEVTE